MTERDHCFLNKLSPLMMNVTSEIFSTAILQKNISNLMTSFRFRPPHRTSINCNEKNKSTGQEKSISIEEKRLSSEHPNIEGLEQKRI